MKFDKSKAEFSVLEPGTYDFTVVEAEDTIYELDDQEIYHIAQQGYGNINEWSKQLRVGRDALKRRLKIMNLPCSI